MTCAQFEILLADLVDETLGAKEQAEVEHHAAGCAACSEYLRDVTGVVQQLHQLEVVTPPPDLITRIAYLAPRGKIRESSDEEVRWYRYFSRWLQPLLQPKLAMSMAMTILSFAMLERCTGVRVQHISAADLNPVRIWSNVEDKAIRSKDRAVMYYQNLRLVYEVERRLKDMDEQSEARQRPAAKPANATGKPREGTRVQ